MSMSSANDDTVETLHAMFWSENCKCELDGGLATFDDSDGEEHVDNWPEAMLSGS